MAWQIFYRSSTTNGPSEIIAVIVASRYSEIGMSLIMELVSHQPEMFLLCSQLKCSRLDFLLLDSTPLGQEEIGAQQ